MNGHIEHELLLQTLQTESNNTIPIFIDPAINWDLFYKYVLRHRVWHQVHNALRPLSIQNATLLAIEKKCQADKQRILITAGETIQIARAFTQKSITHCFVKGTLLNEYIYGDLISRPCRDIDVWVDLATYSLAIEVLLARGYQKKSPTYALTGFKKKYYMHVCKSHAYISSVLFKFLSTFFYSISSFSSP